MVGRHGQQGPRRVTPPLQRWLNRVIMFSIGLYGLVLFNFRPDQQNQSRFLHSITHRTLKGAIDRDYSIEAIQLLHVNMNHDSMTPSLKETNTASTASGKSVSEHTETNDINSWNTFSSSDTMAGFSTDIYAKVQAEAESHAQAVLLLSPGDTKKRSLKCIGWRNTGGCSPDGPREPNKDLSCNELVPNSASGYCEVEDTTSGKRFRVMRRSCNILRNRVPFRCVNAPAFARFRAQAQEALYYASTSNFKLPNTLASGQPSRDGIVMVIYPKLIPSAYATIRALREIFACSLPIEIWFRPDEMDLVPGALDPLQNLAKHTPFGSISFHPITDPAAKRFVAKIYAIYNSFFDRVLFLDADNVPVLDPSFLFNSPEFVETGALFWPDFWHPTATMFGLHSKSLVWELLDTPFVDMFEQESGQLVVDRRRHAAPLELVMFYATHNPNFLVHYKLAWGDKDLFRLAWLKLNASFHMISTPPAMAGIVTNTSAFCGMTMVQHDAEGNILFLHRNKHKLTGTRKLDISFEEDLELEQNDASGSFDFAQSFQDGETGVLPDPAIWKYLMSFDKGWDRDYYVIQAFTAPLEFSNKQKCFGRRSLSKSPQFRVQEFVDLKFGDLEADLRFFAKEAAIALRG
ncbi:unnamed protein product [Phytophthora fragariaefolia]|uniref:Unnamed protein product n=1 Tax=Phytophthora fragariaefolia TaxID=1490495 RepID=A0A9W6TWC5_9STRA|nr:unnamed protein product [Phytophthora fragariaefolia]